MSSAYLEELFALTGRVALVIGGTGELCGRMCQALARAGASVVVAGQSSEKGARRVAEIESAAGKAVFLPVDVTSRQSLDRLCAGVLERFGQLDVLVNGAGVNSGVAYSQIDDDDWDRVLDTNLKGVHLACQIFSRQMVQRERGRRAPRIASLAFRIARAARFLPRLGRPRS